MITNLQELFTHLESGKKAKATSVTGKEFVISKTRNNYFLIINNKEIDKDSEFNSVSRLSAMINNGYITKC